MILPFGMYRGTDIKVVPEDYLFWLCDRGKTIYHKSKHSTDVKWKPPFEIWEAARKEAERRGYIKIGERWVHGR